MRTGATPARRVAARRGCRTRPPGERSPPDRPPHDPDHGPVDARSGADPGGDLRHGRRVRRGLPRRRRGTRARLAPAFLLHRRDDRHQCCVRDPSSRPPGMSPRPSTSASPPSSTSLVQASRSDVRRSRHGGPPWWLVVRGANWRAPYGPRWSIAQIQNHPVVQVTWNDAPGLRPPGAESACPPRPSGSTPRAVAWSAGALPCGETTLHPRGTWACNIWQGQFPDSQHRR